MATSSRRVAERPTHPNGEPLSHSVLVCSLHPAFEGVTVTTVRRGLAVLACAGIGLLLPSAAAAGSPTAAGSASARQAPGYWLVGADGGVFSFGAPFFGSGITPPGACLFSPQSGSTYDATMGCAAIAATPSGNGYWLLNSFRSATAYGLAGQALKVGCTSLNGAAGFWTGIASSPTGNGFFVTASNGGVMGCGDAVPSGGLAAQRLNAPVIGIAATPDGKGYWLLSGDGGVFSFGDARFYGSMGGVKLNAPVIGIAATPDGKGYWLAALDGGVFSFGDAQFYGSTGAARLDAPMVGIAAAPDGKGYWLAGADGGVFSFGSAPFEGSMGGKHMNAPVVGIATFAPHVPG